MSVLKAYRIKFLSKSTPVRSYTLFGAICWAFKLLGGDINDFIQGFEKGDPPFLISDPMPVAKEDNKEFILFPKPALPVMKEFKREDNICLKKDRKKVKKARYVTFRVLREILEGRISEELAFMDQGRFKISDKIISALEEKPKLAEKSDISVRNVLSRINMRSENLFTEEYFLYSDKYFLVWFRREGYDSLLEECFKLIEDNGLGANKNLGWGKVKIEPLKGFEEEVSYLSDKVKESNRFLTLSPVIPKENSIDFKNSYYTIEVHKSPTDSTFGGPFIWKKKVIYIREGAVIKNSKESGFAGSLRDTEMGDFRVFQYGFEFPLSLEG